MPQNEASPPVTTPGAGKNHDALETTQDDARIRKPIERVTDMHATVLHLLGIDPKKLDIPGRQRLDIDRGRVIEGILT